MALIHQVYDTDAHFKVDPVTRAIKNESSGKNVLIQYDHHSERFTFETPRVIDGHDMMKCNQVEIHYINIDSADKNKTSEGVYSVDDLQISPEDENVVICSWLISENATQFAGSLNFLLKFKCVDDKGVVVYRWHTAIFTGIFVSAGIDNGEAIVEEYPDILAQWAARLEAVEQTAGRITETQGEIFNNYDRNKASMRGHAVNDSTEAGWRSFTCGFYAKSDSTAFAGGRLTNADGEGAFVFGLEENYQPTIGGKALVTTKAASMHDTQIPVNVSVVGTIEVGDFINLYAPGLATSDSRKVVEISADGKTITIEYPFYEPLQPAYSGIDQDTFKFPVGTSVFLAVICEVTGNGSALFGSGGKIYSKRSFGCGREITITKDFAFAGGFKTVNDGVCAFVFGNQAQVLAKGGVVFGSRTVGLTDYGLVFGISNIPDTAKKYALIMGNGNANAPANGYTVDWQGNAWYQGNVYVGGTSQTSGAEKLVRPSDLKMKLVATGSLADSGFADGQCLKLSKNLSGGKNYMITFEYGNTESSVHLVMSSTTKTSFSTPNMIGLAIFRFRYGDDVISNPCLFVNASNMTNGTDVSDTLIANIGNVRVYELPY